MTKKKKANLSPSEGIAKNKKVFIIIILLVVGSLGLIGLSLSKRDDYLLIENTRYFTGSLYSANHAANMIDYIYDEKNVVISPFNLNYSLAILYNSTDNNSYKELKSYFKESPSLVNETMAIKLQSIKEELLKETKFTKLYENYINELFSSSYDTLTIETVGLLDTSEKNELLLLLKKISLTKERMDNLNELTEKEIKNYSLSSKETNYNDYSIKTEIVKVLNEYESYAIENQVNNYVEIYTPDLNLEEEFIKITDLYNYKLTNFTNETAEEKTKIINDNIKNETNKNISRVTANSNIEESAISIASTLHFNYEWDKSFSKENVKDTEFYNFNNTPEIVEMMYDVETTYLENNYATGFTKDFENGKYTFVAILPKTTTDFTLSSLDINNFLLSKKTGNVYIGMPKINYQSEIAVEDLLSEYKIREIFTSKANLTKLTEKQTKIGMYTQKINISIAERGTIESNVKSNTINSKIEEEYTKTIILNRPYAYLILNNETEDIMLIGKVVSINESN